MILQYFCTLTHITNLVFSLCILPPNSSTMHAWVLHSDWAGASDQKCHGLLSFVIDRTLPIPFCESQKCHVDDLSPTSITIENNLNFRLVHLLPKLDTVREVILLELVFNIYIVATWADYAPKISDQLWHWLYYINSACLSEILPLYSYRIVRPWAGHLSVSWKREWASFGKRDVVSAHPGSLATVIMY